MKKFFSAPELDVVNVLAVGLSDALSGNLDGFVPDPDATNGDYGI